MMNLFSYHNVLKTMLEPGEFEDALNLALEKKDYVIVSTLLICTKRHKEICSLAFKGLSILQVLFLPEYLKTDDFELLYKLTLICVTKLKQSTNTDRHGPYHPLYSLIHFILRIPRGTCTDHILSCLQVLLNNKAKTSFNEFIGSSEITPDQYQDKKERKAYRVRIIFCYFLYYFQFENFKCLIF